MKKYLVTAIGTDVQNTTMPLLLDLPDTYDLENDSELGRFDTLRREFSKKAAIGPFCPSVFLDYQRFNIIAISPISSGCNCSSKTSGVSKALESAKGNL